METPCLAISVLGFLYTLQCIDSTLPYFSHQKKGGSPVASTTGKWLNDWGLPSKARL